MIDAIKSRVKVWRGEHDPREHSVLSRRPASNPGGDELDALNPMAPDRDLHAALAREARVLANVKTVVKTAVVSVIGGSAAAAAALAFAARSRRLD